jgi:hypothetical protein
MSGRIGAAQDAEIATLELHCQTVRLLADSHRCFHVTGQHCLVVLRQHAAVKVHAVAHRGGQVGCFLLFLDRVKTEAKLLVMFHPEGDKKALLICREHFLRDMIAVVPLT